MSAYATPEEEWRALLEGRHPHLTHQSALRFIPSSPRCRFCKAPFRAPGALVFRRLGMTPWPKNPRICARCFEGIATAARACPRASENESFAGAEVEISMLFADVRGSSAIARTITAVDFTRLMQRFYRTASDVLVEADAIVEKFVGDEVVGLFVPMMTGADHARRAVEAATELLRATGHGTPDGPWLPIGAAVHTGAAFVGIVASADQTSDFTALGDAMNVAAHLASQAAAGEVFVTPATAQAAGLTTDTYERRRLSLKGYSADAFVLNEQRSPT